MKSHLKWVTGGTLAAIVVLLWPGPSVSADTSLGGYQGIAEASVVHIEVFEPVIPIPAEPQGDVSIGYAKSNVDTGPSSRALASYVWPGFVIGDGFEQLLKQPGKNYPVQVNSRYPATPTSPEKNTAQLTDGNGMTTKTDGFNTSATVTGLGVAGPDTNILGGLLKGLPELLGKTSKPSKDLAPVAVSQTLAALVSSLNLSSNSTVTVADKTVTSVATAKASGLAILGGLIQIAGVEVQSKVVSDGTKATTDAIANIGSLSIAGTKIAIDNKGAGLVLPPLTKALSDLLSKLGVSIAAIPVAQDAPGADGTAKAQGLQITIDTTILKQVLNGILNPLVALFPAKWREQLAPVLELQPRIVMTIGNSNASASAAPAYDGGAVPPFDPGSNNGSNGGGDIGGGGGVPPIDVPTGGTNPGNVTPQQPGSQNVAFPGLGSVPRMLILGAIALAALIGWLVTTSAGFLLGGPANCDYGLSTGVPDLRKE